MHLWVVFSAFASGRLKSPDTRWRCTIRRSRCTLRPCTENALSIFVWFFAPLQSRWPHIILDYVSFLYIFGPFLAILGESMLIHLLESLKNGESRCDESMAVAFGICKIWKWCFVAMVSVSMYDRYMLWEAPQIDCWKQNGMNLWLGRFDLWQAICFWIWNLRCAAVFLGEWILWWYRLEAWGDNFQYISGTIRNQEIIWMWISSLTSWSTTRTAKRFLKSLSKNAKIGFEVSFVALTKLVLKFLSLPWPNANWF